MNKEERELYWRRKRRVAKQHHCPKTVKVAGAGVSKPSRSYKAMSEKVLNSVATGKFVGKALHSDIGRRVKIVKLDPVVMDDYELASVNEECRQVGVRGVVRRIAHDEVLYYVAHDDDQRIGAYHRSEFEFEVAHPDAGKRVRVVKLDPVAMSRYGIDLVNFECRQVKAEGVVRRVDEEHKSLYFVTHDHALDERGDTGAYLRSELEFDNYVPSRDAVNAFDFLQPEVEGILRRFVRELPTEGREAFGALNAFLLKSIEAYQKSKDTFINTAPEDIQ